MRAFLSALETINRCRDEPDLLDLLAWRMNAWRRALGPQECTILARHIEQRFWMFREQEEELSEVR